MLAKPALQRALQLPLGGLDVVDVFRGRLQNSDFVPGQNPMRSPQVILKSILVAVGLPAQLALQVVGTAAVGLLVGVDGLDVSLEVVLPQVELTANPTLQPRIPFVLLEDVPLEEGVVVERLLADIALGLLPDPVGV